MQEGDYDAASSFAKDNCRYLDKGTHGFVEDFSSDPTSTGSIMCFRLKGEADCLWVPAEAVYVK